MTSFGSSRNGTESVPYRPQDKCDQPRDFVRRVTPREMALARQLTWLTISRVADRPSA